MGLKAPSKSNSGTFNRQNGNVNTNMMLPGMTTMGRKRGLSFMTTGVIPNKRRLSQTALQRVFIIMMVVVFSLWSTLTIVLVRRGEDAILGDTSEGTLGPPFMNQNNNNRLQEHIKNLSEDKDNHNDKTNMAAQPVDNKQERHKNDSSFRKHPSKKKAPPVHSDFEEFDIHEMVHLDEIKKRKETSSISSSTSSRILTAHLEPIYLHDWETKPLPVRNVTRNELTAIKYPRVNSCRQLPELWPIDDFPNADPFLPWIHDVFPTDDGKFIQFVAQNKRRCQTGTTPDQMDALEKMQPQIALFQHVPIKRKRIKTNTGGSDDEEVRYQLTSHENADPDGIETRFICRFSDGQETLSQFNFDYDYVAKRKNYGKTFTQDGHKDNKSIHTSQLVFLCPVPENLVSAVREGTSVVNDWATLFVSLVPVRTPPRYGAPDRFLAPKFQEGKAHNFSVSLEWGDSHVLPRVEDSGRWENIPICLPTYKAYPDATSPPPPKEVVSPDLVSVVGTTTTSILNSTKNTKKHRVVACAWASLSYSTRGDRFNIDDGARRADEWIRFHLLTGIDHIFIYDNSHGEQNLKDVTDQFPGRVTRVYWPATICNNNRTFHDSPGERSSQYAAESSCRLRFGPHTDWMVNMDIDEFIAPVGEYTSVKPFLSKLDDVGTKIVSFGSWRAWPRKYLIEPPVEINNKTICDEPFPCFNLKVPNNKSILQTYNCDRQLVKKEKMPAEKQIYRTDYVLQHFIHFSTVTRYTMMNEQERVASGIHGRVAPDPLSRFADEQTEVTMLHTKAIATQDTAGWQKRCTGEMKRGTCRIGVPFPDLDISSEVTKDSDGWLYNCYVNPRIETYWVPLLDEELKKSKIIDFQTS